METAEKLWSVEIMDMSPDLDDTFLQDMQDAITAARGEKGDWMAWVEQENPARVQAVLGEGLQRHFGALLRTPLLCSEGGLHVVEPGYMQLVHIANYCMMLAAALRVEKAEVGRVAEMGGAS